MSDKIIPRLIEEHTPDTDNRCKTRRCGGTVVKKQTGTFRGSALFNDSPECDRCGRIYLYATKIKKVRATELEEAHP
jgi:hypothetical protein